MTPLEILRGTRELLAKPERWTRKTPARDASGLDALYRSPEACSFCLAGACWRIAGDMYAGDPALLFLCQLGGFESPAAFNDNPNTTHADILALLDRGIAELEGKL